MDIDHPGFIILKRLGNLPGQISLKPCEKLLSVKEFIQRELLFIL